jgi:paraquat-inducible protein A
MRAAAILLPLALVLNLAALVLPFVTVSIGMTTEDYSLLHTVSMLWQHGFPGLAVLVGLFSVVFPFAKLVALAGVCWWRWPARWASTIGGLGKWSMLDVFLVILLLAVAYDRVLVSATPKAGLIVFTIAILASMIAGELLHEPFDRQPVEPTRWRWLALIIAGIGTAASLWLPLFATDAWFLRDSAFSVVGIGQRLWQLGAWVPALAVGLFLVVMPVMRVVFLGLLVLGGARWAPAARFAGRWSMLEPLALAIFIFEGRETVPSALDHGGLILIVAMALAAFSSTLLTQRRHDWSKLVAAAPP